MAASRRAISSKLSLLHRLSPSFAPYSSFSHSNSSSPDHPHPHFDTRSSTIQLGYARSYRKLDGILFPFNVGTSFKHYSAGRMEEESEKIDYISDYAEVLSDRAAEVATQVQPALSEVAVAAADSMLPVAFLQHVIGGIHTLTGLNWWAAIAVTTLLIRTATVPLLVNQLKATYKLTLMRPHLEAIKAESEGSSDPQAFVATQAKMNKLFKEYGVSPFTPLKGLFIQGPVFISFFYAINNMVEKVPSFKTGGMSWFLDLTTPDPYYIFPVLTGLTFLVTVELNMQEGLEGNPVAKTMKNFSRVLAVATVPFTMHFPKAIFCYWVTSNVFSFCYGSVIKRPQVKKFLGLPEITPQPDVPQSFSLFGESKTPPSPAPAAIEGAKVSGMRISSPTAISQRLKTLERTVKGRSRTKRR